MKRVGLILVVLVVLLITLPSSTASTATTDEKCASQKAAMDAAVLKVAGVAADFVATETALGVARMARGVAVDAWNSRSEAHGAALSEWMAALEAVGNCQMNALNASQCDGEWATAREAEKKLNAAKTAESAAYGEMMKADNQVTSLENKLAGLSRNLQAARNLAGNARRAYEACMNAKPKNAVFTSNDNASLPNGGS